PPGDDRLVIILGIHHHRRSLLLDVAQAARLPCLLARLGEDGEQDGRQNGDDGDHDEQFDERETTLQTAQAAWISSRCHGSSCLWNVCGYSYLFDTGGRRPSSREPAGTLPSSVSE